MTDRSLDFFSSLHEGLRDNESQLSGDVQRHLAFFAIVSKNGKAQMSQIIVCKGVKVNITQNNDIL